MSGTVQTQWRSPRTVRRASLSGWFRWTVLLAIPFSVLAVDTWLNTERLRKDYEMAELTRDAKTLSEALEGLRADEAGKMTMDRIDLEASDIGLVAPQPGQIQIVRYVATPDEAAPDATEYAMVGDRDHPAPAGEKESKPWDTGSHTIQDRKTSLAARLHEAIANVYASYLGAS